MPTDERQGDRLLLTAFETLDASAHRMRVGPGQEQLFRRRSQGSNSISVSSSSRVIVRVSGSRLRSWSRQRLRTMLASHVCGFAFAAV
jgi:hypothetical protein